MIPAVAGELISVERARGLVLERVRPLEAEPVALRECLGRVLAASVEAAEAIPPFENSAMDGYAVRSADVAAAAAGSPVELAIVDESRAGHPARCGIDRGEAIAISTGAVLAAGADAVVRVEDTRREGERVLIESAVEVGTAVRRVGEDVAAGVVVLDPGVRLGAAEVGVLAAVGRAEADCSRRPRVGVLSTGDELVEPGTPLRAGQIRNSNAHALTALAEAEGGRLGSAAIVGDDRAGTVSALERALEGDVLVISGGVSVGPHDHVRPALTELGVEQVFWGVSLRPGKPTYFGVAASGTLVFGLPGNPVSALVTFLLFVRPAMLAMQGADPGERRIVARLGADYRSASGRAEAIRVSLEADDRGWVATPTGPQGSHVLTSMLGADGLALATAERDLLAAGEAIEVELLRWR